MIENNFDEYYSQFKEKHGDVSPHELAQAFSGWRFEEMFILGLLRVQAKDQKVPELSKLTAAKKLLLGEQTGQRGRSFDDSDYMQMMTQWYLADQLCLAQNPKYKCRSIRKLTKQVVAYNAPNKTFEGTNEEVALIERLRKNFADNKENLIASISERAIDIMVLQRLALDEVERVLEIFGMEFFAQD